MGIAMTIEDSGGGDIATAAIAHLAHSTPEPFRFNCSDCNSYVVGAFAEGGPRRTDGCIKAPTGPGLGVMPDMASLGEPLVIVE
jgi:L-alanine-DL-glutamate epimerase-like enolase superfamily enzyme